MYLIIFSALNSTYESAEDDEEEPDHRARTSKKKPGRKGQWSDQALDDFVDVIVCSEYYKRKLIFTNTKNQQNGLIYGKISTELKKRCDERHEVIHFTVPQLRNKFKKCISECKHASMIIKSATGIKRFQEDKGYGAWFNHLFPLVQSRDSCQPEMAVEPSTNSSCSSTSSGPHVDNQHDPQKSKEKQFVPLKRRKMSTNDHIVQAVALLKAAIEQDPTKELISFMREEAEKSRQHELEMAKLLLNVTAPVTQHQGTGNQMQYWPQQQYYQQAPQAPVFQPQQSTFQPPHFSPQGLSSPPQAQTHPGVNPNLHDVPKHYHTL